MLLIGAIHSRNEFGPFLASLGLTGRAVEIGTHRGEFAESLLRSWPGRLSCVDPWSVPLGYEDQARGLYQSDGDRDHDLAAALNRLRPWIDEDRVLIVRRTSADAVSHFGDASLNFVYIDGDHQPPHQAADIARWWPKVRRGGVLAGHDFCCLPGPDNWGGGIQAAVMGFADAARLDVNVVVEPEGRPWSWYCVREQSR